MTENAKEEEKAEKKIEKGDMFMERLESLPGSLAYWLDKQTNLETNKTNNLTNKQNHV